MSHTLEEAKKKYCPMIGGRNECVGDACMMWRWEPKQGYQNFVVERGNNKKFETVMGLVKSTHGYCGMAGKPEVTK